MTIFIIDNYDSFTFNLYQLFQANTKVTVNVVRNNKITFEELLGAKPQAIVLSPGPGHPAIDGDFGVCKTIVRRVEELKCPVLGVCLGHQGIAQHLGGKVIKAPEIVHGKTSKIKIEAYSPIFSGLQGEFEAMRYHSLVVDDATLPDCLSVTARESNQGLIMGLQHKSLPVYGVQFHPESIGTTAGLQMARNFLALC